MKSRTTLILLILVVCAGVFVYWDYKHGVPTEEALEKSKRLFDLKSADVTRVELVRSNQTIVVTKSGADWQIQQPFLVRADDGALGAMLDQLEFAEQDRVFNEKELTPGLLVDFGLVSPRLRLTVRDKKGDRTLLFGQETATKDAIYVQLQGQNKVWVVAKRVFEGANADLDALRSRALIEFIPTAVTRLEIKQVDKLLELDRMAPKTNADKKPKEAVEPRWVITKPFACRADQQKVSGLLNEIANLRIQDFVSEDAKELHACQLDEPVRELTLWTGDKTQTLLIGRSPTNDAAKVYAKLKDAASIVTVAADSLKKFLPQINDVRDGHLLRFAESDVREIEIVRSADAISLSRTGRTWQVNAPVPFTAENSVVQDLLTKLSKLSAKEFVADVATDLASYGLDKPLVTVTLQGAGTNILGQILIGSLNIANGMRYAKRADEPFVYGLDHTIMGWLPASRVACRDRRIGDWKEELVTKFTVEQTGDRVVVERGADKKWKMICPVQGILDLDRLQQTLSLFGFLRAEEFIQEGLKDISAYGLDTPVARCTVKGGGRSATLQIGKPKDNAVVFASWSDPALVFTLDAGSVTLLTNRFVTAPSAVITNTPAAK